MIEALKKKFYSLITDLGYAVTDTGNYEEIFPWLMLRTSGFSRYDINGLSQQTVSFTVDVFSTYNGEKEILEIVNNITDHLPDLIAECGFVMYGMQSSCHIIGDSTTGPVRKHGIAVYQFILASELFNEEEDSDDIE